MSVTATNVRQPAVFLFVESDSIDIALHTDHHIAVDQVWLYHGRPQAGLLVISIPSSGESVRRHHIVRNRISDIRDHHDYARTAQHIPLRYDQAVPRHPRLFHNRLDGARWIALEDLHLRPGDLCVRLTHIPCVLSACRWTSKLYTIQADSYLRGCSALPPVPEEKYLGALAQHG